MPKNTDQAPVNQRTVDKLRHARAQQKKWAEAADDARREILEALKGKSEGTVRGNVVVRVSVSKSSRFDVTTFRAEHEELAALYTKTSVVERVMPVEREDDEL